MKVKKILYQDENIPAPLPQDMLMDVSIASITKDTGSGKLSDIKSGTNIVAVSYAEKLKTIKAKETDNLATLIAKLPKPTPIDEIKIMETEEQKKERQKKETQSVKSVDWVSVLWTFLAIIGGLILLVLISPWLIWLYLNNRAKTNTTEKQKAYHAYTAAMYYLNQLGYRRNNQSPQEYASSTDQFFNTNFYAFTNVYQKIKYSNSPLTPKEKLLVNEFYKPFIKQVKNSNHFKKRISSFVNVYNTLHFFTKAKLN